MKDDIFAHIMNKLSQATVHSTPYPHFYIENIFPDSFYQEMIANLPNTSSVSSNLKDRQSRS
jgi:hypothetical protein